MKRFLASLLVLLPLLAGSAALLADAPADGIVRVGRVLVVANGNSPASVEIARYYMLRRGLPPANLLLVFPASRTSVGAGEFGEKILKPLLLRRKFLGERNIDFVVLCRDVPYRAGEFSATSVILFGGADAMRPAQGYHGQTRAFESCIPCHYASLLPATVLSAYTVAEATALVDASLVTYSDVKNAGRWYFCDGAGPRGARNPQIPAAIDLLTRNGVRCAHETTPNVAARTDILGQFTGDVWLDLEGNRYLPGSILDNLTSFGGYLLDNHGQADLLSFVQRGVCGAYGTVSEPTNNPARWADYSLPARYLAGFNLIEAYLQSVLDWRFGTVVGDPLMAPFNPPPAATLTLDSPSVAEGKVAAGTVRVNAPASGRGLAWAELWLNDQDLLLAYVPSVPAGTEAVLEIRNGEHVLHSRRVQLAAATPLPDLLRLIAAAPGSPAGLEVLPAGKRRDKLLVRWFPASAAEAATAKASCSLTLLRDKERFPFQQPLRPAPLLQNAVILDFGQTAPVPGDAVTVRLTPAETATAAFAAGQPAPAFIDDLAAKLAALPSFGPKSRWRIERHGPATAPFATPTQQIWIVPKCIGDAPEPPAFTTEVSRTPGSDFAADFPEKPAPAFAPTAFIAETVLQPVWPVTRIETRFEVPAGRQSAGHNDLRLIAGTPDGAEGSATASYDVENPNLKPSFAIRNPLLAMREELVVEFVPGPGLAGAVPELLVDGRVAESYPAGAKEGRLRMALPHIAPGTHQLQAQWVADGKPRSPIKPFVPLARSAPQNVFVKRPLTEGVVFSPREVPAKRPFVLTLTGGAYLREGVRILLDGQPLELKRDPKVGCRWTAEVPALEPGPHTLAVEGNAARETGGRLQDLLMAK